MKRCDYKGDTFKNKQLINFGHCPKLGTPQTPPHMPPTLEKNESQAMNRYQTLLMIVGFDDFGHLCGLPYHVSQ